VLYSFCSSRGCGDGSGPMGGLVFDQAGNLYGTTTGGGSSSACSQGCGTAFKLTPNADGSWSESVLYSFCSLQGCRDGQTPPSSLVFDQAGNLDGTTYYGGIPGQCGGDGCGVVYQLKPNADGVWKERVLRSFSSINSSWGEAPRGALTLDNAGNLYGTTTYGGNNNACDGGCGVVFQLTFDSKGSWKEKVLHGFTFEDGYAPYARVTFDQAGNLYGTTSYGGRENEGVVFKLAKNSKGGWSETVLHSFLDRPGAQPTAGVVFDDAGNLYGITDGDAIVTFGSVFEITP